MRETRATLSGSSCGLSHRSLWDVSGSGPSEVVYFPSAVAHGCWKTAGLALINTMKHHKVKWQNHSGTSPVDQSKAGAVRHQQPRLSPFLWLLCSLWIPLNALRFHCGNLLSAERVRAAVPGFSQRQLHTGDTAQTGGEGEEPDRGRHGERTGGVQRSPEGQSSKTTPDVRGPSPSGSLVLGHLLNVSCNCSSVNIYPVRVQSQIQGTRGFSLSTYRPASPPPPSSR